MIRKQKEKGLTGSGIRLVLIALFVFVTTLAIFRVFFLYAGFSLSPTVSGSVISATNSPFQDFNSLAGLLFIVVVVAAFLVAFFLIARREKDSG